MNELTSLIFGLSISGIGLNIGLSPIAYAQDDNVSVESSQEELQHVSAYMSQILGPALASGLLRFDKGETHSYQVLSQVLNSGKVDGLPYDLRQAIGDLYNYVPDPYLIIQPVMSPDQIKRMEHMTERIMFLLRDKYGVDFGKEMEQMKTILQPQIPEILRSCSMEGDTLPTDVKFRPRLGDALNQALARLQHPREILPAVD